MGMELFFGDQSLLSYLGLLCHPSSNLPEMVLIDHLQVASDNVPNTQMSSLVLKPAMLKLRRSCDLHHHSPHYLGNVSTSEVEQLFGKLSTSTVQLIFSLTFLREDLDRFLRVLSLELAQLYDHCRRCLPFILLLDWQLLRKLPRNRAEMFPKHFGSILLNHNDLSQTTPSSLVMHLNPVLDGCVSSEPIFMPKTPMDFARLRTPPSGCDLNYSQLNVSVSRLLPYCDLFRLANGTLEMGYAMETELLHFLGRKFHFRPNFIDGRQVWGSYLVNSTWSGMMGQVLSGHSQLAMCEFTLTERRLSVVDFSRFLLQNQITFMSQSPGVKQRNWLVAAPFQWPVWASIILTVVGVSVLLHRLGSSRSVKKQFSSVTNNKDAQPPNTSSSSRSRRQSFAHVIADVYQIVLNESTKVNRTASHTLDRLLYGTWILMAIVLSSGYGSSFYSLLTVPEYDRPVDTVADLVGIATTDSRSLVVKEGSSNWIDFMSANPDENRVYHLIGQHLNRTEQRITTYLVDFMPKLDQSAQFVVIANRIVLRIHRHQFANRSLHIGSENLGIDYTGYIYPKRSPLVAPFDRMIIRAREMALLDKWIADTFARLPKRADHQEGHGGAGSGLAPFDLRTLYSIFLLWVLGVTGSSSVLLVEFLHSLYYRAHRRLLSRD